MSLPVIVDLAVAAVFLIFAIVKGKKGLYRCIKPLIVVAAAVIGATVISAALARPIADWVYPKLEEKIIAKVDFSKLEELPGELTQAFAQGSERLMPEGTAQGSDMEALLDSQNGLDTLLGSQTGLSTLLSSAENLLPESVRSLAGRFGMNLRSTLQKTVEKAKQSLKDGVSFTPEQETALEGAGFDVKDPLNRVRSFVVGSSLNLLRSITEKVIRVILWIVLFFLLQAVASAILKALGFAFDLPVIGWVDKLGGAALGLVECAAIVFIVSWVLRLLGIPVLQELAEGTKLLSVFV